MQRYVIFGAGRVGVNMAAYLERFGHQVHLLSRRKAETERSFCEDLIHEATIIAAAIPDDKLSAWREDWRAELTHKRVIHFSGALTIDGVSGFHPLYSFPRSKLSFEKLKTIAFACPAGGPSFEEIFPGAPNPHFKISDKDRPRYHALAVLTGNLAGYVWNETAKEFADLSGLPPQKILGSYLESVVDRFVENPTSSLTGPVARHDEITVRKNQESLSDKENLKSLYKAFVKAAWPEFEKQN